MERGRGKQVLKTRLFQLLCGIDTRGSQELIRPFHLEYMILNRTIASV